MTLQAVANYDVPIKVLIAWAAALFHDSEQMREIEGGRV